MLSNTGNGLSVDLDTGLVGNLSIQANNGLRSISLTGGDNSIGGNLYLTAGTGNQTVNLATTADLAVLGKATVVLGAGNDSISTGAGLSVDVTGDARFDLGTGSDTFGTGLGGDLTVGGSLNVRGGNTVSIQGALTVTGNISIISNFENVASLFTTTAGVTTPGNFSYYGGNRTDTVNLGTAADVIDGNVYVYLGTNILGGDQQFDISGALIGGNVNVNAGNVLISGGNNYVSDADTQVDGNIYIRFGTGFGSNDVDIAGTIGGQFDTPHTVSYVGGAGVDNVTLELVSLSAGPGEDQTVNFYANLGAGADVFVLEAANPLNQLFVDFGAGVDVFTNNFGAFTFPAFLLHLA
jgi:hypothetical protein